MHTRFPNDLSGGVNFYLKHFLYMEVCGYFSKAVNEGLVRRMPSSLTYNSNNVPWVRWLRPLKNSPPIHHISAFMWLIFQSVTIISTRLIWWGEARKIINSALNKKWMQSSISVVLRLFALASPFHKVELLLRLEQSIQPINIQV